MDLFAEALSRLRPEVVSVCLVELGAPWGASAERNPAVVFQYVQRGSAWLEAAGGQWQLERGDLVLHLAGHPHTLRDHPRSPARPMSEFVTSAPGGALARTVRHRDGRDAALLCGAFSLDGRRSEPLLTALPALVRVPAEEAGPGATIESTLTQLVRECQAPGLAATPIVRHLAHVLLMQVLRAHAAREGFLEGSWLAALLHPRLGRALEAVHAAPAAPWTVASLARVAGMSRSSFADSFKRVAGVAPLGWLTEHRMRRAEELLEADELSLAEIARRVGYGSPSSLHAAFVRWAGHTPGEHRRHALRREGARIGA